MSAFVDFGHAAAEALGSDAAAGPFAKIEDRDIVGTH
jgi:hypothetical protein